MSKKVTEVKKLVREECNDIKKAVKLILTLNKEIPANNKLQVTILNDEEEEEQFLLSRTDLTAFISQITYRLDEMPQLVAEKLKSNKRVSNSAGLQIPYKYNDEFIDFFSKADFGNLIKGELIRSGKVKKGVNMKDAGVPINDGLFFTKEKIGNHPNPLYGITTNSVLTTLLANHSYYADLRGKKNLTLSPIMRESLRETVSQTINNGIDAVLKKNEALTEEGEELRERLLQALDDESIFIPLEESKLGGEAIFNPNNFTYPHFSKLTSTGKIGKGLKDEVKEAEGEVIKVFGDELELDENEPARSIFEHEQEIVSLSNRWKNEQMELKTRRDTALEREKGRVALSNK